MEVERSLAVMVVDGEFSSLFSGDADTFRVEIFVGVTYFPPNLPPPEMEMMGRNLITSFKFKVPNQPHSWGSLSPYILVP